jgi:hypothetical protein
MKLPRRHFLRLSAAAAALWSCGWWHPSDDLHVSRYPQRHQGDARKQPDGYRRRVPDAVAHLAYRGWDSILDGIERNWGSEVRALA